MGRIKNGKKLKIFSAALLILILLIAGCDNNLLETLERDVERATNNILTINTDGNGITSPSGEVIVKDNEVVNISATPYSGYVFFNWSGTGIIFGNRYSADTTVKLQGSSATITANFADALSVLDLTINSGGNGSTDPSGTIVALPGNPVSISADPDFSYEFTNWTITGGSPPPVFGDANLASTTVSVTSDSVIQANFSLLTYDLTVNTDGSGYGTVTPSGTQNVIHGNDTPIEATLTADVMRYFFREWTVTAGTASIGDTGETSTTAALTAGDATVQANFDKYDIYWGDWSAGLTRNTRAWDFSSPIQSGASDIRSMDLDIDNGYIYYVNYSAVKRCKLDGSEDEVIVGGQSYAHGICVDTVNDKVYWVTSGSVLRSNLDGSNVETLSYLPQLKGIDIDIDNQLLYISNLNGEIFEYNISTTAVVQKMGGLPPVFHLKVDPVNNKLYASSFNIRAVLIFDLTTFNQTGMVGGFAGPNAVDVDPANNIVAVMDSYMSEIVITDLDGNIIETLPVSGSYPYAVAIDPD